MGIGDFVAKAQEKTEWQSTDAGTPPTTSDTTTESVEDTKPLLTSAPSETPAPTLETKPQPTGLLTNSPQTPENSNSLLKPSGSTNTDEILSGIFSKIGEIGQAAKLKLMIFGDPGSAKSSFAATAPNNLIIDFEDGLISAKGSPNGIATNVRQWRYEKYEEFTALIKAIRDNHPELASFDTITIDTLSDLHKRGLAEVTQRDWRKAPKSTNQYVPQVEHHTENNEKIIRIVRALRDCDKNIIILTHAKTVEPKNKDAKTYADFSESLSNKVMAMMDIAGFMHMKRIDGKTIPVLRTTNDGSVQAKTRIPLPEEIADPTFPQLLKKWEEASQS